MAPLRWVLAQDLIPITGTAGNELRNCFVYLEDYGSDPLFHFGQLLIQLILALEIVVNQVQASEYRDLGCRRQRKFSMYLFHLSINDFGDFLYSFSIHIVGNDTIVIPKDVYDNLGFLQRISYIDRLSTFSIKPSTLFLTSCLVFCKRLLLSSKSSTFCLRLLIKEINLSMRSSSLVNSSNATPLFVDLH
jgi:hypothetical protein